MIIRNGHYINESYEQQSPRNCPVIEADGDGRSVGTCTFYLNDGECPRHGQVKKQLETTNEPIG